MLFASRTVPLARPALSFLSAEAPTLPAVNSLSA